MTRFFNPPDSAKPGSRYWMGALIPPGWQRLELSGQVGMRPDGSVPEDFESQCRQAFANLFAVLREGGMAPSDLVKLTVFLTRTADVPAYRTIRDAALDGHAAASTLLVISALANPAYLVEIEGIAARP